MIVCMRHPTLRLNATFLKGIEATWKRNRFGLLFFFATGFHVIPKNEIWLRRLPRRKYCYMNVRTMGIAWIFFVFFTFNRFNYLDIVCDCSDSYV